MLALLFVSSLALAQSGTHCEPVKGGLALVYQSWSKSGGAMPGPGTPMEEQSWTLGEERIGHRVRPYLEDIVQTGITWTWDEGSHQRKKHSHERHQETETYTVEVTLSSPTGEPIHALIPEPTFTVKVRCESVRVWGVP